MHGVSGARAGVITWSRFPTLPTGCPVDGATFATVSVCHLEIGPGHVEAIVSGSELYCVTIEITQLNAAAWESIKAKCSGQIEMVEGFLRVGVTWEAIEAATGLTEADFQVLKAKLTGVDAVP